MWNGLKSILGIKKAFKKLRIIISSKHFDHLKTFYHGNNYFKKSFPAGN